MSNPYKAGQLKGETNTSYITSLDELQAITDREDAQFQEKVAESMKQDFWLPDALGVNLEPITAKLEALAGQPFQD